MDDPGSGHTSGHSARISVPPRLATPTGQPDGRKDVPGGAQPGKEATMSGRPDGRYRITVDEAQWDALQRQARQLTQLRDRTSQTVPGSDETAAKTPPTPMGSRRIFISYRHDETDWQASWLADMLADRFGKEVIFKDVDAIQPGDDFVEAIKNAVGSCEVLIALIGNQWLTMTGRNGQRRLDDPADIVRLEIEAALERNVRVIPVLVQGAHMPHADELPASLAMLARRQAVELNPRRLKSDVEPLLKVLGSIITNT
jgi:hypothetical protein